jgi:hypothetical protein
MLISGGSFNHLGHGCPIFAIAYSLATVYSATYTSKGRQPCIMYS